MNEKERFATLTSDAVRVSGDKVIKDVETILATIDEAAADLRHEGEQLIENIRTHTNAWADRVGGFVNNCQSVVDMIRAQQSKFGPEEPPKHQQEMMHRGQQRTIPVLINDSDLDGGAEQAAPRHQPGSLDRLVRSIGDGRGEGGRAAGG